MPDISVLEAAETTGVLIIIFLLIAAKGPDK